MTIGAKVYDELQNRLSTGAGVGPGYAGRTAVPGSAPARSSDAGARRSGALGTGGTGRKQTVGAAPGACSLSGQAGRAAVSGGRARKSSGGSLAREAVGR